MFILWQQIFFRKSKLHYCGNSDSFPSSYLFPDSQLFYISFYLFSPNFAAGGVSSSSHKYIKYNKISLKMREKPNWSKGKQDEGQEQDYDAKVMLWDFVCHLEVDKIFGVGKLFLTLTQNSHEGCFSVSCLSVQVIYLLFFFNWHIIIMHMGYRVVFQNTHALWNDQLGYLVCLSSETLSIYSWWEHSKSSLLTISTYSIQYSHLFTWPGMVCLGVGIVLQG